jgi:predicted RNase H-like HicB family nuclease
MPVRYGVPMKDTTIRIRVTKQNEQFLGECLEFPVMTHGRTLEELAENMEKALLMFLSERGEEVQEPSEEMILAMRVDLVEDEN